MGQMLTQYYKNGAHKSTRFFKTIPKKVASVQKIQKFHIFSIKIVGYICGLFMGYSTPQSTSFNFDPVLWKLHDLEVGGGAGGGC